MREVHIVIAACEQITVVLHVCVDLSCGDARLPVSVSALSPDIHRQFEGGAVVEERGEMSVSDATTQHLFVWLWKCAFLFLVLYLDSLIYEETAVLASSFSLYHFNIPDGVWYLLLIESNKIIQKRFMDLSFIWNCFYCRSICQWPTVNPKVSSMQEVWVN